MPAVIFSGSDVKTLKKNIDLFGGAKVISSTTDPTSSAVSAPIGSLLMNETNGKLYRKLDAGSSTNWVALSSGGDSGVNYISANSDAEVNTTGWLTYADAAQNIPVNGTAGTANSTWTRTTSTPLRGTGSFLWTKTGAANRQGEGVAYAFTLSNADLAKPLQVSFSYKKASGTFTASNGTTAPLNDGTTTTNAGNSDLEVFLYDVTNGTLIVPSPQVLTASSSIPSKYIGTFQTSATGTSYLLIIHTATSTTNDYTVQFDDFYLGPQTQSYGAAVTDWISYTPTTTWVSNATATGQWRRVGDTMQCQVRIVTSGAPTTANLRVNIPSGYTIDTAKMAESNLDGTNAHNINLGLVTAVDNAAQTYEGFAGYFSTTQVTLNIGTASGTHLIASAAIDQATPFTFGANDRVSATFQIPIVGWSSNVLMSNDTDSRVCAAQISSSGTQSINNATFTKINFTSSTFDTHGAWDGTNKYTVQVAGVYKVWGTMEFADNATGSRYVALYKNGSEVNGTMVRAGSSTTNSGRQTWTAALVRCIPGDYLEVFAQQTSGGSMTMHANSPSQVSFERLTGPATIASSEVVVAKYASDASQSIASGSDVIVDFEDKIVDTHGAVTTGAAWKFTAPVSGNYQVSALAVFTGGSTFTAGNTLNFIIFKNGSLNSTLGRYIIPTTDTTEKALNGATIMNLNAGDYIQLNLFQNTGGARTLLNNNSYVHVSIHKIN
jgi:hypothetical protein